MSASPLVCFSLTPEEYAGLAIDGPRRDIPLMAEAAAGELLFRRTGGSRKGLRAKLFGPQLGHAWEAAKRTNSAGVVFADGEHVGFPLAMFLAVRRNRGAHLLVLGHYVDKAWKRMLLRVVTRAVPKGILVLHSRTQADSIRSLLPSGWKLELLPYQVDTEFWTAGSKSGSRPLIVSAGSENRDYRTLIEAVRELQVDVCIASGSHWAREQAAASNLPSNVRFLTETLSFSELRDLYARATAIAVPLLPVKNQSGITTILEAMSMSKPVIVSATPGQREAVAGPLIQSSGEEQPIDRGPHLIGLAPEQGPTGLYVPPGDAVALRHAIQRVVNDGVLAGQLGTSARASVVSNFTVEQFARRFAALLAGSGRAPQQVRDTVRVG